MKHFYFVLLILAAMVAANSVAVWLMAETTSRCDGSLGGHLSCDRD